MSGAFVVELMLQLGHAGLERRDLLTQLVLAVLNNRHEHLLTEEKKAEETHLY